MTVLTGFATQALLALNGPLVARMLGVHGRGQVAAVFVVAAVASQLTFGGLLPTAIAQQLAQRGITGRDGLRRLVPRWLLPSLVPPAGAAVIIYLVDDGDTAGRLVLAALGLAFSFCTIWYALLIGILQGERNVRRLNAFRFWTSVPILVVLAVAFTVHRHWGPLPVLAAYDITSALGLVFGFLLLRHPSGRREDELDGPALWRYGRRTYISSTGPIDGLGIDQLLVAALLGQVQLGLYVCAVALANISNFVARGIGLVLLGRVAGTADAERARRLVRGWLLASAGVIVVIIAGVEVIAGPVIRIAFGDNFAPAIGCARVLVVATGLLGFRRVLMAVLQGDGRGGLASVVESVGVASLIGAVLVVVGTGGGIVGVAWAAVGVGAGMCLTLTAVVLRPPATRVAPAAVVDAVLDPVEAPPGPELPV